MYTVHKAGTVGELARKLAQAAQIHGTDCTWEIDEEDYDKITIMKGDKVVGHIENEEVE